MYTAKYRNQFYLFIIVFENDQSPNDNLRSSSSNNGNFELFLNYAFSHWQQFCALLTHTSPTSREIKIRSTVGVRDQSIQMLRSAVDYCRILTIPHMQAPKST